MAISIDVAIPTIPPRSALLDRALASVRAQTRPADMVHVATDHTGEGAAATRNRAAAMSGAEALAFLDDDDEFAPDHLATLAATMEQTGADYVWSGFIVPESPDFTIASFCTDPATFDPDIHQTTVAILVRRELFETVGGFQMPNPGQLVGRDYAGEDAAFTRRCFEARAKFAYTGNRSYRWHHTGANTSGMSWPTKLGLPPVESAP